MPAGLRPAPDRRIRAHTVALDINPLLLLAAGARVRRQAASSCTNSRSHLARPPITRSCGRCAHRRRPGQASSSCSAMRSTRRSPRRVSTSSLTPWLVDIVDDDFADLCARRINRLLRPGGHLDQLRLASAFGAAARRSVLASTRSGSWSPRPVSVGHGAERTRDSLHALAGQSPCQAGDGVDVRCEGGPGLQGADAATCCPPGCMDPRQPIPLSEHFEVTAVASRLQAVALALIDGERTPADIGELSGRAEAPGPRVGARGGARTAAAAARGPAQTGHRKGEHPHVSGASRCRFTATAGRAEVARQLATQSTQP